MKPKINIWEASFVFSEGNAVAWVDKEELFSISFPDWGQQNHMEWGRRMVSAGFLAGSSWTKVWCHGGTAPHLAPQHSHHVESVYMPGCVPSPWVFPCRVSPCWPADERGWTRLWRGRAAWSFCKSFTELNEEEIKTAADGDYLMLHLGDLVSLETCIPVLRSSGYLMYENRT